MSEKTQWEVEYLQKENEQQNVDLKNHEKRLRNLESFKDSTVEKLITIFRTIDDMKEDSRWMKRMFTSTLVGGIVTAVISLIVWFIQM